MSHSDTLPTDYLLFAFLVRDELAQTEPEPITPKKSFAIAVGQPETDLRNLQQSVEGDVLKLFLRVGAFES